MWKAVIVLGCFVGTLNATPIGKKNMEIMNDDEEMNESKAKRTELALSTLNLPSNATSIRADLTDDFSCDNLTYGYYADIDNDCQVFHVCLPVVYPDGRENTFRWSFICPEETVFSQDSFTCMRSEDMSFGCDESAKYYDLNRNFGNVVDSSVEMNSNEMEMDANEMLKEKETIVKENEHETVEEVSPMLKKTEEINEYTPTLTLGSSKLDGTKKKRKNPIRKTVVDNKSKVEPIRKLTTTTSTTPIPPTTTTTTVKPIVKEVEITETPIAKTTTKYQRYTRRPDHKDNNKKKPSEILIEKVEPIAVQKRKRPPVLLNLNIKKANKKDETPIEVIPNEQQQQQQQHQQETLTTESPIVIIKQEPVESIPIDQDKIMQPIFVEEPLKELLIPTTTTTTIMMQQPTEKIPETFITVKQPEEIQPLIIPEEKHEENIAEINRIPMLPQFIKTEESMPHNNEEENHQDHDQQSMIINLISSLVNAENSKAEEEQKFDYNLGNVQQSPNNEQFNVLPEIMNTPEIMTTKILQAQDDDHHHDDDDEHQTILNSEHVHDVKDSLKNTAEIMDKVEVTNNNNNKYQSEIYSHLAHIPVRFLPIEDHSVHSEMIVHEPTLQTNEMDKKNDIKDITGIILPTIEVSDLTGKPINLNDQVLEAESLITNNKQEEEKLNEQLQNEPILNKLAEIVEDNKELNSEPVIEQLGSNEIQPIFHRTTEPLDNLLLSDILTVKQDDHPIVHDIEDENIIKNDNLKNFVESDAILALLDPNLIRKPLTTDENLGDKIAYVIETPSEFAAPHEEILEIKKIDEITDEPQLEHKNPTTESTQPIIASVRSNVARSLSKNKMDPRKRRFLFRSDARRSSS